MSSLATKDYLVRKPFIYVHVGNSAYLYDNPYAENLWDNPSWNKNANGVQKKKSFFDPCPPGWRIAENDIWSDLIATKSAPTRAIQYDEEADE